MGVKTQTPALFALVCPSVMPPSLIVTVAPASAVPVTAGLAVIRSVAETPGSATSVSLTTGLPGSRGKGAVLLGPGLPARAVARAGGLWPPSPRGGIAVGQVPPRGGRG